MFGTSPGFRPYQRYPAMPTLLSRPVGRARWTTCRSPSRSVQWCCCRRREVDCRTLCSTGLPLRGPGRIVLAKEGCVSHGKLQNRTTGRYNGDGRFRLGSRRNRIRGRSESRVQRESIGIPYHRRRGNHPDPDVPQAESWFAASRAKRPIEAGQEASRRGKSVSLASSSRAAATGIASNAPAIPSSAPPNRTATTVTSAGTATVFPMIFGTSR